MIVKPFKIWKFFIEYFYYKNISEVKKDKKDDKMEDDTEHWKHAPIIIKTDLDGFTDVNFLSKGVNGCEWKQCNW